MAPDPNSTSSGPREEASVKVPSKDPKKKDEKKDEDLSDEDLALKQQLELYVERVQDSDPGLQKMALESMRQEIRTATSSMTSVPKPLKFLRPHYGALKSFYETMGDSDLKKYLADILSVLALTMSAEGELESPTCFLLFFLRKIHLFSAPLCSDSSTKRSISEYLTRPIFGHLLHCGFILPET